MLSLMRTVVTILVVMALFFSAELPYDYMTNNEDRMNVKDGIVIDAQPGDVLINRGTTDKPRCFKIATFDVPDKYPIEEDFIIFSDNTVTDWAFRPDNGDSVNLVFVRGMKTSAKESHQNHLDMVGLYDENGNFLEEDRVTIAKDDRGLEYYAYLTRSEVDGDGSYTYLLRVYLECGKDSSVLISVNSRAAQEEDLADYDTLMAYAKEFMARITPVK